jgi:chromosome segregation ATPase
MGSIAERLQGTKTGNLTQTLETDVIEALKELIEATQKEMQEMKEQQQGQQQQGQPKRPDLVDLLAELKVLRSLQLRVNRRTKRINELLADPDVQASNTDVSDLQQQLAELARRQDRLRESAIELAKKLEKSR